MTSRTCPLPVLTALLLPVCMTLGGCVVGGTAAVPFSTTTRIAAAETMTSRLEDMSPTATMPTASTASYRGYLIADATVPGRDDPLALLGTMRLTADFGASQIDGSFSAEQNAYIIDGTLSGEFLGPDAEAISGDATGDVLEGATTVGSFTGTFGLN